MNLSSESPWQLAVREGEVFTSRTQLRRYNSKLGRNRQFCQWLIKKNACPQNHYPASRQEWVWSNRKSNPKSLSHVLSQRTFWAYCKVSIPVLDDTKEKKNPFGFQEEKWKIKLCWSRKCWKRFTEWTLTLCNCRCGVCREQISSRVFRYLSEHPTALSRHRGLSFQLISFLTNWRHSSPLPAGCPSNNFVWGCEQSRLCTLELSQTRTELNLFVNLK